MLVAFIDIFVIKLFSYDLKDHTFILQTPEHKKKNSNNMSAMPIYSQELNERHQRIFQKGKRKP
jgi:hypothetical protein